jgi:nucleotide-binding universal stress UspA family protein
MSSTTKRYGIIVGIDGSPVSDAAVRWAAHDAAIRGLPLTLVHVEDPAAPTWSQAPILEESPAEQQAEGRSLLVNASKIARDAIGDTARIQINGELLSSAPVPALVDQSNDAELIVVGSTGRGALSRGFLGSVSSGLIRHAHCPVALIRDEDPQTPHPAEAPVLVGIDGSTSDLAAAVAFEEASRRHADLIALHAWNDTDMSEIPGYDWSPITTKEDRLLTEALAGWQERYPDVIVHKRLVRDRAARALVDASESTQLVVVGSHGSGAFAGMLLGSVSNAVVQAVHKPVIVARPS